jgi:hypothetical protein
MGSPQPKRKCCCESNCDDCTNCPGPTDTVYIVLLGTAADGVYTGSWDVINERWNFDFGVCTTYMVCTPGGDVNFTLFDDQDCPIGGTCDGGSPLVLTPAPGCDNCDLGLPDGTLSIFWSCDDLGMMMMAAPFATETSLRTTVPTTNVGECIHKGEQIGEHTCETCSQKGRVIPVYHCNLFDKPCVWRWWTNEGKKRTESGELACVTCRERTLFDGTKPWDSGEVPPGPEQKEDEGRQDDNGGLR